MVPVIAPVQHFEEEVDFRRPRISMPAAQRRICTRRSLDGQTQHGPADRESTDQRATNIKNNKTRPRDDSFTPKPIGRCECSERFQGSQLKRNGAYLGHGHLKSGSVEI